MEKIAYALERAKAGSRISANSSKTDSSSLVSGQLAEVEVNSAYLVSKRIVAHNGADHRSRPYEILRTQVMKIMDEHRWKVLGVTSPTPECGKTVTAINLAFSIARLENRSALLIDLDLRKAQVANYLGLSLTDRGILDVLEKRISHRDATVLVRATATDQQIAVLPAASAKESAELMGSRAMGSLLQDLRRDSSIVILDLPPTLSSDDVISILPQIDCILLVAAAGRSTASDIQESIRYLDSCQIVRVVLNKATDETAAYYY